MEAGQEVAILNDAEEEKRENRGGRAGRLVGESRWLLQRGGIKE